MLYRHGLRESELCKIRVDDLLLNDAKLYVNRLKGSTSLVHPIAGDEMRLIRRYLSIRNLKNGTFLPRLFFSEQQSQFHRNSIINIVKQSSDK